MSETDHDGDEHLPPAEMAAIRDPARRRLAYFRKYGVWLVGVDEIEDNHVGGSQDGVTEISRKRARARGWSEDEIDRHYGIESNKKRARELGWSEEQIARVYGPSIHENKPVGEKKA
jgi:hypothetical protein